jgi:hypothetical protein
VNCEPTVIAVILLPYLATLGSYLFCLPIYYDRENEICQALCQTFLDLLFLAFSVFLYVSIMGHNQGFVKCFLKKFLGVS